MSDERCGFERDDGHACEAAFGLCESCGFCWNHCPHREDERREARRRGGFAKSRKEKEGDATLPIEAPPAPLSVEEAARMLSWLSGAVLRGEVDRHTARDVGGLLRAFVNASETDVEDRLEKVEGLLENQRETIEALQKRLQMKAAK